MKKSSQIYTLLETRFGQASCELNFKNNYELLVAVVLSARCTDKRVNIVTDELFSKYPMPKDLAAADEKDVEKIIYSCGFYKNKTKSIIALSQDIQQRFNGVVPDNYEGLISLRGVGRKTANVVLSVGFAKQAIAVDTHVFRLANRLGLANSKTPLECELSLQKKVDKDKWSQFHHYLVLFGRYICKSQNPNCNDCELKQFCKYNTKGFKDKKY